MRKRILWGLLAVLLVLGVVVASSFARWRSAQAERLAAESRVADTAKGPVEYVLRGSGPRTVLFVHGTPGGYDQGRRLERTMLERGYRLLTVSRPGYLRTPLSTGRTPAEQADAYAALLDALGIERVNIIGASGGGPSSAQFAARHPERCESLVMLSAVSKVRPKREPSNGFSQRLMSTDFGGWLAWRRVHGDPAESLARRDSETRARILRDPDRVASYLQLADSALVLVSRRVAGIGNDVKWFSEMPEIPLARIRCPTLAIHAREDPTVPLEHAQHVADQVPGAELVVVEGAGHLVSISHPEETFGPILELLDRAAGGAELAADGAAARPSLAPAAAPPR